MPTLNWKILSAAYVISTGLLKHVYKMIFTLKTLGLKF